MIIPVVQSTAKINIYLHFSSFQPFIPKQEYDFECGIFLTAFIVYLLCGHYLLQQVKHKTHLLCPTDEVNIYTQRYTLTTANIFSTVGAMFFYFAWSRKKSRASKMWFNTH